MSAAGKANLARAMKGNNNASKGGRTVEQRKAAFAKLSYPNPTREQTAKSEAARAASVSKRAIEGRAARPDVRIGLRYDQMTPANQRRLTPEQARLANRGIRVQR